DLGVDCGIAYYLTGDEDYAQLAADILSAYTQALAPMNANTADDGQDGILFPTHTLEGTRVMQRLPLIYDFVYPFIQDTANNKVYDAISSGVGDSIPFDFDAAQQYFEKQVVNVIAKGSGHVNNWDVYEAEVAYYALMCINDSTTQDSLFNQLYNVDNTRQSATTTILSTFTDGLWPESGNYSITTSEVMLRTMNVIDRWKPALDIMDDNKHLLEGTFKYADWELPNGGFVRFGDSHRYLNDLSWMYTQALALSDRKNYPEKEAFGKLLKAELAKSGGRDYSWTDPNTQYIAPLRLLWGVDLDAFQTENIDYQVTSIAVEQGIVTQRNYFGADTLNYGLMAMTGGAGHGHLHAQGIDMELYGHGYTMGVDAGEENDRDSPLHTNYRRVYAGHNTVIVNGTSWATGGWKDIEQDCSASIDEILEIVSEFDASMNELREKRSPISILKFEYETMKNKAEIQADQKNLFTINNALKILNTAEQMAAGNPSVSRIDRIEVLLTWASEIAPEIKDELDSYSKDAYKIRASDILQRAKSIENLIEVGLVNNRFLPGYEDFTEDMKERINIARNLVVQNDLDSADIMVRDLFSEWRQVSTAYADKPLGSDVGYSADELKRIEYRKQLDFLSATVSNFYNADFAPYSDEFVAMTDDASELIDYGNFIDAESQISEIRHYLAEHLPLKNDNIIYDISYDLENDIWILEGFVNKPDGLWKKGMRQDLYVTVYEASGEIHSNLEFTDTKHGKFFTQWHAPTEPGLYVVMLQYMDHKTSQLVNVEERIVREYGTTELDGTELAREYEELENFIEVFGETNYGKHESKFDPVLEDIKTGLANRDSTEVKDDLSELKQLIERYLPVRSKSAVIEVYMEQDTLYLSGAIVKPYINFREDIFIDIFDQKGERIDEIALKDTPAGKFNQVLSKPYEPGMYVAQLWYHDLMVSDFFHVR
ncbi:hypothetical protein LCGC14_1277790, partial [marine sediment metagenome]